MFNIDVFLSLIDPWFMRCLTKVGLKCLLPAVLNWLPLFFIEFILFTMMRPKTMFGVAYNETLECSRFIGKVLHFRPCAGRDLE